MKIRTVALIEWNWVGHHPMYFTLFVRALLDLGCTVAAFCPEPSEVESRLQDLDAEPRSRLTLRYLAWLPAWRICPGRFRHRLGQIRILYATTEGLRRWERERGRSVELVFFSCIYDHEFQLFRQVEWLFPYRWSGLYLNYRAFRKPGSVTPQTRKLPSPERLFSSRDLHSIAILDEGAKGALETLSKRPVVVFPDMTDDNLDSEPAPVAVAMKQLASGSPIIAVLGHLLHRKGVSTLAKLADDPANSDLCFAFVGEAEWGTFNLEDRTLISSLAGRRPNVFTHFARVQDENAFNSCVKACDIIFAAYIDYPNSSGILTKAAVFQKPILVSDGYLMAERVRQYQLGEVVPENDAEASGRAIRKLLEDCNAIDRPRPKWREYCEKHSYESLKAAFSALLAEP